MDGIKFLVEVEKLAQAPPGHVLSPFCRSPTDAPLAESTPPSTPSHPHMHIMLYLSHSSSCSLDNFLQDNG